MASDSTTQVRMRMAAAEEASGLAPHTLTMEQSHAFHVRVAQLKASNAEYLSSHPEIHQLLQDLVAHICAHKPSDVRAEAAAYFARFQPTE